MNTDPPVSRQEAREAIEAYTNPTNVQPAPVEVTATLEGAAIAPEFMPLAVRRVLYIVGLLALVVAPTVGVEFPDYATAITTAGNLLGAAALGTALANPSRL